MHTHACAHVWAHMRVHTCLLTCTQCAHIYVHIHVCSICVHAHIHMDTHTHGAHPVHLRSDPSLLSSAVSAVSCVDVPTVTYMTQISLEPLLRSEFTLTVLCRGLGVLPRCSEGRTAHAPNGGVGGGHSAGRGCPNTGEAAWAVTHVWPAGVVGAERGSERKQFTDGGRCPAVNH